MGPTALLARYIGRQFLLNFLGLFLAIMAIVWVFEFVEQLRRVSTRPEAGIGVALELSLLKLPITMEHLVHFTVLFGAMFTFWRLTRSQELVIARASGVSAWQFLFPVVAAAVLIGAVKVAMVNPVSAVLVAQFEALEDRYIHGRSDLLAVSRSGLWLREKDEGGFWVIHAQRTAPDEILLENALFLRFDPQDRYTGRIDAETARLDGGAWHLERAWLADGDRAPEFRDRHSLPSRLTAEAIQDGFAPPEALSFWDQPQFIAKLEATGF